MKPTHRLLYCAAKLPFARRKYCNICEKHALFFLPFGIEEEVFSHLEIVGGGHRKNCTCPHCLSRDRFRFTYHMLRHHTDLWDRKHTVLHIAPEPQIAEKIRKETETEYCTGDIVPGRADLVVNITAMQFPDQMFDYIIVNHVLEHIEDEAAAFSEMKRCLKPDGKLILSFPVCLNQPTCEDKQITDEAERLKTYGQIDHCRLYGYDCKEYLERYDLKVTEYKAEEIIPKDKLKKWALLPEDVIFFCEK